MRHSTAQSVSEQLSWKRVQTEKCRVESLFMERYDKNGLCICQLCL